MDKREQILLRLEAILTAIATDTDIKVWRDRAELDDTMLNGQYVELPAFVLLDGVETKKTGSADYRGPQIMLLSPQIFFVPLPTENQLNVGVGPNLSTMRMALLKGIMQDDTLLNMLGTNGYIEYRGIETDMQTGAEVKGQFRLDMTFAYVFDFTKI